MGKKRFHNILFKNTVAVALPAVTVLLILLLVFSRYDIMEQARCQTVTSGDDLGSSLEELGMSGVTNVRIKADNLYYTGFDYYVDGRHEGSYYYVMDEESLSFILISTKNPVMHLESVDVKGKLIKDSVSTEHILNRLSADLGMDSDKLAAYCSGYVVSEPDYPVAFISMIYVFFYAPVVICILIIAYTVLVRVNPLMHSQARQLAAYGEPGAIIDELDLQLRNKLIYRKNNIYITEDYMIVSYLTKTDVIKLDYIKYLSKNLVEREHGMHKREHIYRLTMSNPEKLFYEVDFTSETLIDDVVRYIRGVNDNVNNKIEEGNLTAGR